MIDATVDQDFAAFERQESVKEAPLSETVAVDAAPRVYRGRLSSLSPRLNRAGALHCPPPPSTSTLLQPPPLASTSLSHLRSARLGFAAVIILVLYWLWIRFRNKAV